jgi:hypothetical protein
MCIMKQVQVVVCASRRHTLKENARKRNEGRQESKYTFLRIVESKESA